MVKITFLNLLRSKYGLDHVFVEPGIMKDIFQAFLRQHPGIDPNDFKESVMFVNQARIAHANRFDIELKDGDEVVFTHFLGGG